MEAVKQVRLDIRNSDFLADFCLQTQDVATAIAAKNFTLALSLRDPEFEDCLHAFRTTTRLNSLYRLPEPERMRIGIIQSVFSLSH